VRADITIFDPSILRIEGNTPLPVIINARTISHRAEVGDDLHVHHAGGWPVLEGWTDAEFVEVLDEVLK